MSRMMTRKNKLSSLFKVASSGEVYDSEDVYDYSQFIKDNFYDPDANPDLKIEVQDSDLEILEEFDGVMERLEILVERRFDDDEGIQPHDFMDLFRKELQDMVAQFDSVTTELGYEDLNILYKLFGQYLGMYPDYEQVIANDDSLGFKKTSTSTEDAASNLESTAPPIAAEAITAEPASVIPVDPNDENIVAPTETGNKPPAATSGAIRPETMNSTEVGHVQAMLVHIGYSVGSSGVDGDFGRGTFRALRSFQRDNEIPPTGVVGPETMAMLIQQAPNVQAPSAAKLLSSSSSRRIFEKTRTEDEASEDVGNATDVIQEIANSGSFSTHSSGSDMSNLTLRSRVKTDGMDQKVSHLLGLINEAGSKLDTEIAITSGFRTPADQSRIMFYNWNRKGGVGRGSSYLLSLYRRFRRIGDIASAFERTSSSDDSRKAAAEQIINDSWQPFRGHLDGLSLDVSFKTGKYKVGVILSALQELGIIRLLEEDDHYHITAKNVPSPQQSSMV